MRKGEWNAQVMKSESENLPPSSHLMSLYSTFTLTILSLFPRIGKGGQVISSILWENKLEISKEHTWGSQLARQESPQDS